MLLNLILVSRGGDPAVFSVLKGSFISPFFCWNNHENWGLSDGQGLKYPQIVASRAKMPEILLRISLSILNYGWCPRGRRTGHEFLWPRELGVEWSEICIATYVSQKYQLATALAMLQRVLPATSEARQVEQKDIFFVKAVRRSHERHQMSYPKKHPKTVAKPPQAADWIYCDKSMVNIFLITEIVSQRTHVSWIYLPSGEHTKSNGKIHPWENPLFL